MNKIPHALSLGMGLSLLWLVLSGHYTVLLVGLGLFSVSLVVYLATRMDVVDHEGHPIHLRLLPTLHYWGWLLKEIILANIDVCRRILAPGMPISPTIIEVRSTQHTVVGRVIYANSITLTPGTVSMSVDADIILVHALSVEGAASLKRGEMDQRITAMEQSY